MFIAESPKVIERALDAGCVPVSLLVERSHCNEEAQRAIAQLRGCSCLYRGNGYPYQAYRLPADPWHALRHAPAAKAQCRKHSGFLPPGDGAGKCYEPHQCGAIFRSAAALGMDAVLLTSGCTDPLYRRSARVSMGTVFQVPWAFVGEDWQKELRDQGFATAAMALAEDSLSIDDPILRRQEKLAVVLGTEGDGLAKSTIAACDYTVKIPMYHGVDSLNVAAASAVAFWELRAR